MRRSEERRHVYQNPLDNHRPRELFTSGAIDSFVRRYLEFMHIDESLNYNILKEYFLDSKSLPYYLCI
jgi:hypothetical protein